MLKKARIDASGGLHLLLRTETKVSSFDTDSSDSILKPNLLL